MDDIISEAKFVSSENDKRLRKEVLRSDLFETDLRLGNSGSTVAQTRANALMDGRNNLYYIGKNKGNGIPPTQVNTEVSQSAVSETVPYNSIISNAQQKATPASKEVSDNILNALYKPTGVNRAAFELAAGVKLPDTSGKTRSFFRSVPDILSTDSKTAVPLDNGVKNNYDALKGGVENGRIDTGAGISGAEPIRAGTSVVDVSRGSRNAAGNQRIFRQSVSDPQIYARAGATTQNISESTAYPDVFCAQLEKRENRIKMVSWSVQKLRRSLLTMGPLLL